MNHAFIINDKHKPEAGRVCIERPIEDMEGALTAAGFDSNVDVISTTTYDAVATTFVTVDSSNVDNRRKVIGNEYDH